MNKEFFNIWRIVTILLRHILLGLQRPWVATGLGCNRVGLQQLGLQQGWVATVLGCNILGCNSLGCNRVGLQQGWVATYLGCNILGLQHTWVAESWVATYWVATAGLNWGAAVFCAKTYYWQEVVAALLTPPSASETNLLL